MLLRKRNVPTFISNANKTNKRETVASVFVLLEFLPSHWIISFQQAFSLFTYTVTQRSLPRQAIFYHYFSHVLCSYLTFLLSQFKSKFPYLKTASQEWSNQELKQSLATKNINKTTWKYGLIAVILWIVRRMYWRVSTTTTSISLRVKESSAHKYTSRRLSCKCEKKPATRNQRWKTQTARVSHAQPRKQEKHISKRLLKHFRPTLLTAGRKIARSYRITVGRCLNEKLNFRSLNTEHNWTVATWRQFYSIRDTFLEALLIEAYL